jgi:hypothetical protein
MTTASYLVLPLALGASASNASSQPSAGGGRVRFHLQLSKALEQEGLNISQLDLGPREGFNRNTPAKRVEKGFVTSNRDFYSAVLRPVILGNRDRLMTLSLRRRTNALLLLTYLAFDAHFGKASHTGHIYRWGGDLFDIDHAQIDHVRTSRAFGLDCSGYVSAGFDVAIREDLLSTDESKVPFFAQRREQILTSPPGQASPHRLNVSDFAQLGREVSADEAKAGDYIVMPPTPRIPHVIAIVEVNGQHYVAESANRGIVTKDYIHHAGELLPLNIALARLHSRKVPYVIRSVLSP